MSDYPEKTCEIENLVKHPKLVEATLAGRKTQQRRDGVYAYPDETFDLEGVTFKVTSLEQQRLGDITDADAQAEGYPTLEMYKALILKMHAHMPNSKASTWNEDDLVWVHSFEKA